MNVRLACVLVILSLPLFSGKLCGVPGRPVDGWFGPTSTEYQPGNSIQYYCEPRNLLFGSVRRTCQEDGTWNNDVPVCGKPISVKEVFQSSTLGNLTADKAIDGDYTSYSSTGLLENGYWTAVLGNHEMIAAVRITFPVAKGLRLEVLVTNGSTSGPSCGQFNGNTGIETTKVLYCPQYSIGNTIRIQDYLDDPDSLQLKEVEIFARKETPCLQPDIPANGFVAKKSGKKDTIHYFCASGYVLNGTDVARCYPNATWSPRAPVCEDVYCEPPPTPDGGTVNYDIGIGGVPFGGFANYTCNQGYTMQGKPARKCVGQNIWSTTKPPKCAEVQCGNLSFQILNGRLEYSSLRVNSVALLRCNEGYRPFDSDRLVCQPNQRWSQSILRCNPIRCRNVSEMISNGKVELLDGSTFYGSRLRLICDYGFKLSGEELRMCGENGTWGGDIDSVCLETTCPPFVEDVEGGHWMKLNVSDVPLRVGVQYGLECHQGYEFIGDYQFTVCMENGSWFETNSYCLEVMQPDPSMSSKEWSPKMMMMTAMGIGVGSALCILCLVAGFFLFKKKSQYRNSPPVFHVGIGAKPIRDNLGLLCSKTSSADDHYYSTATAIYEEVQQRAPPLPKQRKPRSALPPTPPPLDADAVYSQPFEEAPDVVNKVTQDDDQAHIYAEPVDTCSLSSECQQNLENQRKDKIFYDKPRESIIHMENSVIYEATDKPVTIKLDMISNDIYLETK